VFQFVQLLTVSLWWKEKMNTFQKEELKKEISLFQLKLKFKFFHEIFLKKEFGWSGSISIPFEIK
jgi:hypothetical protein